MRKLVAVVIAIGMAAFAVPSTAFAAGHSRIVAQGQSGTLNGVAQGANRQALTNYTVRVRNVQSGQIAGTTTSNSAGSFSFAGLQPGNYVVEVVNAAGQVVGLSPATAVVAGATVSVTVSAAAAGAIAAASAGGFSLLGLGTVASVAVVTAAGVAGVVAVVAANNNASPSK